MDPFFKSLDGPIFGNIKWDSLIIETTDKDSDEVCASRNPDHNEDGAVIINFSFLQCFIVVSHGKDIWPANKFH
jgi:hypothetical protein